jgi:hypothetical protein
LLGEVFFKKKKEEGKRYNQIIKRKERMGQSIIKRERDYKYSILSFMWPDIIEREKGERFQIFPSPNLREKHLNCQAYTSFRLLGRKNTLGKELTRSKLKKL